MIHKRLCGGVGNGDLFMHTSPRDSADR
jgi:hypothetical protein